MKNLSIKKLIDFRGKSDKAKKKFVDNIKSNKIEIPDDGGGDYWIASISAVSKSYERNDLSIVNDKIQNLEEKLDKTSYNITKNMYQRNIANLKRYSTLDLKRLKPRERIEFLKKSSANSLLSIKGLQVQSKPNHIFKFKSNEHENVGAIWFVAKLNGYKVDELGMFTELLYRCLKTNYSKVFQLNPQHCIAIDIVSGISVNYSQLEKGQIPAILTPTIDEINKLM